MPRCNGQKSDHLWPTQLLSDFAEASSGCIWYPETVSFLPVNEGIVSVSNKQKVAMFIQLLKNIDDTSHLTHTFLISYAQNITCNFSVILLLSLNFQILLRLKIGSKDSERRKITERSGNLFISSENFMKTKLLKATKFLFQFLVSLHHIKICEQRG